MKKILTLIVSALFLSCGYVCAKQDKKVIMPAINFGGNKYSLYYSAKIAETGGYINEYYKPNQTYAGWNELIGVHHYPTAFYPIDHARAFKDFLNASGGQAFLEIYDEDNMAILYFTVVSDKRLPIVLEFNVFKYQKSPICGTVALQYAKRYLLNNGLEVDGLKRDFANNALKYIKRIEKLEIPDIVTVEIEKGKYVHSEDLEKLTVKKDEEIKPQKSKENASKKNKDKKSDKNKTVTTEVTEIKQEPDTKLKVETEISDITSEAEEKADTEIKKIDSSRIQETSEDSQKI